MNPPPTPDRPTVLIADDDPLIRRVLRGVLQHHHCTILEAESGLEALDLCHRRDRRIDLLITDVMMPTLSGLELARRARDRWPELRVIFMSANPAFRPEGEHPGEEITFLAKPFMVEELVRRVSAELAGGPGSGEAPPPFPGPPGR